MYTHRPLNVSYSESFRMGFSPEEVKYLCDVACSGDHGMAAALGLKVHFTSRFSDGNGANCEIVIEKADEE